MLLKRILAFTLVQEKSQTSTDFPGYSVWLVAAIALAVKLALYPFSQQVDADAVSRILTSEAWAADPHWIVTGVWAPFHYYLNGLVIMLFQSRQAAPVLVNILLSALTLFPLYYFTRREFSHNGAVAVTFFFAISPVVFRYSFLVMAETPALFFIALTMNQLSLALRNLKWKDFVLAGFFLTLASGFRYEAWLLIALFGLLILIHGRRKQALVFGLAASVFPLTWMIQNYLATGDAMYSISANSRWTLDVMGTNKQVDFEAMLRRIWFFPFSWLIAFGPPLAWIVARQMSRMPGRENFNRHEARWMLPFAIFLLVMIYNSVSGKLLLHQRFSMTPVLLSIPFAAPWFSVLNRSKIRKMFLFGLITIALSMLYTIGGVKPLPRLKDQRIVQFSRNLIPALSPDDLLVVDFAGWENTFYLGLQSGKGRDQLILLEGSSPEAIPQQRIREMIEGRRHIVFLINNGSSLSGLMPELTLSGADTLLQDPDIRLTLIRPDI
ncbi:MAG: glycosyltransferase family 39 protein [Lentimicrobium sp.]|nr:glycosyltransferase family 39 protein [Lentimicrobium sp.]